MAQPRRQGHERDPEAQRERTPPSSDWFWRKTSPEQLAREQRVGPLRSLEQLRIPGVTPEEVEAMIAERDRLRSRNRE